MEVAADLGLVYPQELDDTASRYLEALRGLAL